MKTEFDIQLKTKDMFRFNLYHTYTSLTGYLPFLLAALLVGLVIVRWTSLNATNLFLYLAMAVLLVFYTPLMLYVRSKQQVISSPVLSHSLHYVIDDSGIGVSQGEADSKLEWHQVFRLVATKSNILIFSSPRNAFILPRDQVEDQYETIRQLASGHLESYRFKMKG